MIGFMGSGKSTVGPLLAKMLSRSFVDLDANVEHSAAKTCAEIFADAGEEAFRSLEAQALMALADAEPAVVACGADGYVLKARAAADLVPAVRQILEGKPYFRGVVGQPWHPAEAGWKPALGELERYWFARAEAWVESVVSTAMFKDGWFNVIVPAPCISICGLII